MNAASADGLAPLPSASVALVHRASACILVLLSASCGASTAEPARSAATAARPAEQAPGGSEAEPVGGEARAPAPIEPDAEVVSDPLVRVGPQVVYDTTADVVFALAPHARAFDAATGAPRWAARRATGDRLDVVDGRVVVTSSGPAPSFTVLSAEGRIAGRCDVPLADPSHVGTILVVTVAERVGLDLAEAPPAGGAPIERPGPVCAHVELELRGCRATRTPVSCEGVAASWGPARASPRADRVLELVERPAEGADLCAPIPVTLRVTAGESAWETPLCELPGRCPPP